ncbi:MAG: ComF family protein [Pseudomonadota bacterium]
MASALKAALHLIYPPRCLTCWELVEDDFGLCASCWRDTPFISGLACDHCGVPLPGEDTGDAEICDDCLRIARPWSQGRAALLYRDLGRKLVLSLKHGDRSDLARPAAQWLARAAKPLLRDQMLIAPVPLHWSRMLKRRFNQSAVLAEALARHLHLSYCPDLLLRSRRTPSLDGLNFDERFRATDGAITPNPTHAQWIKDRPVLIVDDVMTAGATLSASTQAAYAAGASEVCVLVLARAAKDT